MEPVTPARAASRAAADARRPGSVPTATGALVPVATDVGSRMRRPAFLRDLAFAIVVAYLAVWPPVDVLASSIGVAAVAFTAIAVRSVSPGLGLAAGWVVALSQVVNGERPGFADLALLLVLYTAARSGGRFAVVLGGLSALFGGSVGSLHLLRTGARFTDLAYSGSSGLAVLAAPVAILVIAWLSGVVVRAVRGQATQSRLRVRAEDVAVRAVDHAQAETLRASMARDVHDIVGHSLAVIIAQADSVQFLDDEQRIRAVSSTIADTARRSLQEVREVLNGTSTADADDGPEDLEAVVSQVRAAGVDVGHEVRGVPRPVDPARQVVLRRVAQEMMTNAMRHGEPGTRISFRETWRAADVVIEVDNAVAASGTPSIRVGTGVEGMRARLAAVGGDLEAEAVDDVFTARARIPLPGPALALTPRESP